MEKFIKLDEAKKLASEKEKNSAAAILFPGITPAIVVYAGPPVLGPLPSVAGVIST